MPRRTVSFAPGHYYHLYNRGVARQSIFRDHENYLYLLRIVKKLAKTCRVTVIAYCLLPNHYHMLVRQEGNVAAGKFVSRLFLSYSKAFNRMYARTGTLFEGRYKVILVESDEYLRHLCRYIHANPVTHGLALSPDLWLYSNYLEWLGLRNGTLVDRNFIQSHFTTPGHYAAYVKSYLTGQIVLPKRLRDYLDSL